MLKREDIKNGTLVYDSWSESYGYLQDVGDARLNGHRIGISTTPDDELSYSLVDIITGKSNEGICEISAYNEVLKVVTTKDIDVYLAIKEADTSKELAEAKKKHATIQDAINKFEKMKQNIN